MAMSDSNAFSSKKLGIKSSVNFCILDAIIWCGSGFVDAEENTHLGSFTEKPQALSRITIDGKLQDKPISVPVGILKFEKPYNFLLPVSNLFGRDIAFESTKAACGCTAGVPLQKTVNKGGIGPGPARTLGDLGNAPIAPAWLVLRGMIRNVAAQLADVHAGNCLPTQFRIGWLQNTAGSQATSRARVCLGAMCPVEQRKS